MSGIKLPPTSASTSNSNRPQQSTNAKHNDSTGATESHLGHALRVARQMYDKMPEAQRVQREAQLAGSRFDKNDKTSPLLKSIIEMLYNIYTGRSTAAPGQREQSQRLAAKPPSHLRTQTDRRPAQPRQPAQKPILLPPIAQQHQGGRLPTQQELQARQLLANGIPSDGQTPASICAPHRQQVRDLQAWASIPAGSYFKTVVPAAPEVFRESVTGETALLPMCNGCAIIEGAITATRDADGQTLHQVQVVDTCSCASAITKIDPATMQSQGCWFCALGRIEAAKQIAMKQRALKDVQSEPLRMASNQQVVLSCACGAAVDLPEIMRKCVGCGGIKTKPFTNFGGNRIIFLEGSEQVTMVQDAVTGKPVASTAATSIPSGVPHHQLPPLTRSDGQDPDGNTLDVIRHGKKRTTKEALGSQSVSQAKRTRYGKTSVQKPSPGERPLFSVEQTTELAGLGLDVFFNFHKDLVITPAYRAETLLRDNFAHKFDRVSTIHTMLQCGFREETAVSIMASTHDGYGYGEVVTGAQILEVVQAQGTISPDSINTIPATEHGTGQEVPPLGHVPLHPLFDANDKNALMKLGYHVPFNGHPEPSKAQPAYRAEVLLNDNVNNKVDVGRLNKALTICGLAGWRLEELIRDVSDDGHIQHVSIADTVGRLRAHGMLQSGTALPAPAPMPASTVVEVSAAPYGQTQKSGEVPYTSLVGQQTGSGHGEHHVGGNNGNANLGELEDVWGVGGGEGDMDASHAAIDPALLNLHQPLASLRMATPPPQQLFAFTDEDLELLANLRLRYIPAPGVIATLPTAVKRAGVILKAHESSDAELSPGNFALMLEACGCSKQDANEMAASFDAYPGGEEKCYSYLEFFEGDFV